MATEVLPPAVAEYFRSAFKSAKPMYDTKCADLAETFLEDEKAATKENIAALAQAIQTTIEDWLKYELVAEAVNSVNAKVGETIDG